MARDVEPGESTRSYLDMKTSRGSGSGTLTALFSPQLLWAESGLSGQHPATVLFTSAWRPTEDVCSTREGEGGRMNIRLPIVKRKANCQAQ